MTIPIGRNLRQSGKLRETVPATEKSLTKYKVLLAFSCTTILYIISNFWSIFSTKFEVEIIYNEPKNETKYNSNNFTENPIGIGYVKNKTFGKIDMKIEYGIKQIKHKLSKKNEPCVITLN
jgi:hypothetical protein